MDGIIVLTQYDEILGTDIIAMDLNGMKGVTIREDLDYQVEWESLVGFIGMKIKYIVKGKILRVIK